MRIVKDTEHQAKRQDILAIALELLLAKGYDAMSIQDILDARHISKGAFYHYFDSKQALLAALVDQMREATLQRLRPIVEDAELTAPQKLQHYFEASLQWKQENSSHTQLVMRLWHNDRNSALRQKVTQDALYCTAPLLTSVVQQGIAEQVFATRYPRQVAMMITGLALSLADEIASHLVGSGAQSDTSAVIRAVEDVLLAYTESVERMLAATPGSLNVFDREKVGEIVRGLHAAGIT